MANGMRTEVAVMNATASKCTESSANIASTKSALMGQLAPLTAAWTGSAGSTFQSITPRVEADYTTIHTALAQVAELVRTAGRNYDATDSSNTATVKTGGGQFGNITNGLQSI